MANKVTVYIITDKPYGTLYVGQTNDLPRRMHEHKNGLVKGFAKKYDLKHLVYYATYENPSDGFVAERRLKKWNRQWKIDLIHSMNREWRDLWEELNR